MLFANFLLSFQFSFVFLCQKDTRCSSRRIASPSPTPTELTCSHCSLTTSSNRGTEQCWDRFVIHVRWDELTYSHHSLSTSSNRSTESRRKQLICWFWITFQINKSESNRQIRFKSTNQLFPPCFFCFSTKDSAQHLWNLVCPISSTENHLSRIEIPQKNMFSTNSILICSRSTDELRGKRTPDSSSLCLRTSWQLHFGEIREYRLPSNHSRSRQTDAGFEFPVSNYPWHHRNLSQLASFPAMFFWPDYRQTDKQTNFNFVRPSFQSREPTVLIILSVDFYGTLNP